MNLNVKDIMVIAGVVLVIVIIGNASYDGLKGLFAKKGTSTTPAKS